MIDAIIITILIIAIIIASGVNRFDAISEIMLVNFEFTIKHGGKEGKH